MLGPMRIEEERRQSSVRDVVSECTNEGKATFTEHCDALGVCAREIGVLDQIGPQHTIGKIAQRNRTHRTR